MNIRTQFIIALAFVASLLSCGAARAADYAVKIGADTQSGEDASSLICWFDHICHGELKELGLQVDIDLRRAMSGIARLRLHSRTSNCCYLEYGRDRIAIDLRAALHREPIFNGEKARDGMVIEKEACGIALSEVPLSVPGLAG